MENEKNEMISAKYITADTDHMEYQPGMDNIGSEVQDEVISRMNAYDADAYTAADVLRALRKDVLSPEDFGALLSPAALPFLDYIPEGVTLLPNTSGARNADEAVRIARLSRACGCGDFVKIEIMRDSKYLLPDNQETIRATEILANEGFVVMPYMYPDLNVARDLVNAGAASIMPLAAPHRYEQGSRYPRVHQNFDRRNRSADHRGRRHRPSVAGLRGDGDGRGSHHGQHRDCHRRRYSGDG